MDPVTGAMDLEDGIKIHRGLFSDLEPNGVCLIGLHNCLGLVTFSSFNFLSFRMQMPITIMLCLCHHYTLGTENLFSSFTGPQLERTFALGWIIHKISPISYLEDFR